MATIIGGLILLLAAGSITLVALDPGALHLGSLIGKANSPSSATPARTGLATTATFQPSPTLAVTAAIPKATQTPAPSGTAQPLSSPFPTTIPSPTQTPPPAPTPIGGSGGQIAFVSERNGQPQIWVMDADGSNQHPITNQLNGACQPDWSPDGERLVFISPCSNRQIRSFLYARREPVFYQPGWDRAESPAHDARRRF